MWGALGSAGFGAFAARLFSLNLRRRQEKYEAAFRKSDLDRAHKQELDAAVAKVVQLFGEYIAAAQAFMFAFAPDAKLSVETPHAAGARLLASFRVAQMTATAEERFRRAGRMHHLGIGVAHRGTRCILLADEHTITVVRPDTGEVIATNTINPDTTYWRNNKKEPGRWPSSSS